MIKFAMRPNSIYPLLLFLLSNIRDIESILINYFYILKNPSIFALLMFFGEFITGLIFYLYHKKFMTKDKNEKSRLFFYILNIKAKKATDKDNKIKILCLIFYSSFLDFLQFTISLYFNSFITISYSLQQRFRSIFNISLVLFYFRLLKLPIYAHQICSLIVIGVCLLIIIITEFIFQEFDIFLSLYKFIYALLLMFLVFFVSALAQTVEKYLIEFNGLSPFYILMNEGLFGLILTSLYIIFYKLFDFIDKVTTSEFVILIISLILYIILSGGKNLFRLVTLSFFSPITSTFAEYIFNPFYIIYYFVSGKDFFHEGKSNYPYFITNLILSLIISFSGFVYNDFLILFCCGLERDTYKQVALRSLYETELVILNKEEISEEEEEVNESEKEGDGLFKLINMGSVK